MVVFFKIYPPHLPALPHTLPPNANFNPSRHQIKQSFIHNSNNSEEDMPQTSKKPTVESLAGEVELLKKQVDYNSRDIHHLQTESATKKIVLDGLGGRTCPSELCFSTPP
jgi:hypothetical protein